MAINDYVGRTIDVLGYQGGLVGGGEVLLTQALATETSGGQITTGIQKLGQRFLLELLTETGSMPYAPNRGCDFMAEARQNLFRSSYDILAAFSAALVDITNNLQNEESEEDPDDERFETAEVLTVSLNGGKASLTIQVASLAGTSREVIAPLNVTV